MAQVKGMLTLKTGRLFNAGMLGKVIVVMCLKAGLPLSWFGTVTWNEVPSKANG
tara:strand:- start:1037 stop:1198 length:162 start_codon:yes stop_codon:yes gene_type:complete